MGALTRLGGVGAGRENDEDARLLALHLARAIAERHLHLAGKQNVGFVLLDRLVDGDLGSGHCRLAGGAKCTETVRKL